MTNDLSAELADLTPEQRELLAIRLREARAQRRQPLPPRPATDRLPLSFTQEQLWFLDRLDPGTPVYNVPFALRLRGPLDQTALRGAVAAVVDRHEALRIIFIEEPGEEAGGVRQVVRSRVDIPLPVVDLRSVPEGERGAAIGAESAAHGRFSFDLRTGPLLAVRLLVLADDEHLLLVNVHHIVFDAWSGEIFINDLVAYYGQLANGEPARLPALAERFGDYARRQREPEVLAAVAAQLEHWRGRLAGAPSTSTLRPDRVRPAVQTHRGGRHAFTLSAPLNRRLTELARELGVTLNAVLLAGFAALLRQATGQDDLLFGMPAASRPRVELEPLIGCFANMLVLRMDLSGDPTVRELISRAHRTVGEAYLHQDAPYARVVEEVAPPRDPGLNPMFQVMITIGQGGEPARSAAGVEFTQAPVDNQLTDFDIFVTLTHQDGDCEVVLDYNADLYLAETADQVAARLDAVLADLAGDPDRRISAIGSVRRQVIALAATFTVDLVREPLQFWLDFLRAPAGVECVGYGQMIPHLLTGGGESATVCLLRWEDWLRHWDVGEGPVGAANLLDAAMGDLTAAVEEYRRRSSAPLFLLVCPSSPRFTDRAWTELFARLDDQLSQLAARIGDVHAGWAVEDAGRYPVPRPHDPPADELGHVPYTSEYFAVLGTLAARALWRASGRTPRLVVADAPRLPCGGELARLLPHLSVVSCPAGEIVDRLDSILAAAGCEPQECVVLDPDPAVIAALRCRYPRVLALVAAADEGELRRELAHLWVLDRPTGEWDGPFTAMGPERASYLAGRLADPVAVAERVAVRAVASWDAGAVRPALVAPRTATEQRLAGLWCEVLRLDEVGTDTDFFSLGGHSLLATQLLSRIQREFGREVSLYRLFTNPTITQLAAVIDDAGEPVDEPLRPVARSGAAVASSVQHRLWALAQIDDEAVRHNTTYAATLRGDLNEPALREAVHEIVRRHEVLRTVFVERRGRPAVVLPDDQASVFELVDISGLAGDEPAAAVRDHVERHVSHRYDLASGPLLRVRLLRAARDEHHLLVGMHHIICDNVSWQIFLDELATLYDAFSGGLPSPLPALPMQFADFAHHQQEWLSGEAVEPHLAYWREELRDAPAPIEPAGDRPESPTGSDLAGRHARLLPAGLGRGMRELARAEGVTPFSVVLAVFAALLHQETGEPDLVVGMPTNGRDRPELGGLIGCFADLLPLRLRLAGRPSFRRLVRRLHTTVQEAHAHQRVPLPRLMEALRPPRNSSRHPLKCVLNYTDLPDETPTLSGVDIVPLPVGAPGADFDLLLTVDWRDDNLHTELTYSAELYSEARAAELATAFGTVLAGALADPDAPIGAPARVEPRPAPPAEATGIQPVTVASSFPADRVLGTLRFWSELLPEPALSVTGAAAGQVLRPLLDPATLFGADPEGLNVVLLRWEDWLASIDRAAPGALPAAVGVLERTLYDLCAAVFRFGARSDAPLLLGVCPASPELSDRRWTGVLSSLTERLRRFCEPRPGVRVVSLDHWARRYGVKELHADAAYDGRFPYAAEFDAAVATWIARESRRRWHPHLSSLVLSPQRFPAAELTRLVRRQIRCGRDVVLTSRPASPELAGLVTTGAVRLAGAGLAGAGLAGAGLAGELGGDLVGQFGVLASRGLLDPQACLVLDTDPATVAAIRQAHPQVQAFTVDAGEALDDFARHLWVLDRPVPEHRRGAACGIPDDLLLGIATELNTAEGIWSAVESGYRPSARRSSAAPRTDRERALAAIWAEALHMDEVGVDEDFYELGGDSLLTITVAFHAGEAGIELTARQIMKHRTIAALCRDAVPLAGAAPRTAISAGIGAAVDAEQGIVAGGMPLTPAQLWWCETLASTMERPEHFNHPYYMELRRLVPVAHLAEAVRILAEHHDSLRLRFERGEDGTWRQWHAAPAGAVPFTSHDLSALPAAEQDRAMVSIASAEQSGLRLAGGPTCRVVHFGVGSGRPDRLLIVAHHLVTDAVSRGVLLNDLQTLCGQLGRGEPPRLPAKTTSYRAWARRLAGEASSARALAELPFWLDQGAGGGGTMPPDAGADAGAGVAARAPTSTVDVTLPAAETAGLHDVARRLRVNLRDLLVWGVVRAVLARTRGTECAIATTGHGREDLFDDVDVSRTAGWFQVIYPVRLRLPAGRPDAESVAESVVAVAEQLARVPRNGIGHGLLRFSCPDPEVRHRLADLPAPRIAVNYMGSFGFDEVSRAEVSRAEVSRVEELFDVCHDDYGPTEDESGSWPFDLDVVGALAGGQLRIEVSYATAVYRPETAGALLDDIRARLRGLLDSASGPARVTVRAAQSDNP